MRERILKVAVAIFGKSEDLICQHFPLGDGYSVIDQRTGEVLATAVPRDARGGFTLVSPRNGAYLGRVFPLVSSPNIRSNWES